MRCCPRTPDRPRRQTHPAPQGLHLIRSTHWKHCSAWPRESWADHLLHLADTTTARRTRCPTALGHQSGFRLFFRSSHCLPASLPPICPVAPGFLWKFFNQLLTLLLALLDISHTWRSSPSSWHDPPVDLFSLAVHLDLPQCQLPSPDQLLRRRLHD